MYDNQEHEALKAARKVVGFAIQGIPTSQYRAQDVLRCVDRLIEENCLVHTRALLKTIIETNTVPEQAACMDAYKEVNAVWEFIISDTKHIVH